MKLLYIAALFAVAAVACIGVAVAPPVAPPQEPATGPIPITVLCVGSMTEERAAAILDGVPADLWTFEITTARGEGTDWTRGSDRVPSQPGQGDLPVPLENDTLAIGNRSDSVAPVLNRGIALGPLRSIGMWDAGDTEYSRAVAIHELLHCEPGVRVLHTQDELDANAEYRAWAANTTPPDGDAVYRSNAWGIWQAREARA